MQQSDWNRVGDWNQVVLYLKVRWNQRSTLAPISLQISIQMRIVLLHRLRYLIFWSVLKTATSMISAFLERFPVQKSTESDGIHAQLLKMLVSSLAGPLTSDNWSYTIILANRHRDTDLQENRPVIMTFVAYKIVDHLIRYSIKLHLTRNNILNDT